MSVTQELVRNVLDTHFEAFSKQDVEHAKNLVIDIVGCTIVGLNYPGSSMIRDLAVETGGKEESSILVHGDKVPADAAAMVNSILARSADYEVAAPFIDGVSLAGHISATTVPTAIALAEGQHLGGKELITALILGEDLAVRLNGASNRTFAQGWESAGTVAAFGAAAVAGRLKGLNENQMVNAFGILINQLAGTIQSVFEGTLCFKLPQGLAARNGIFSADLASRGFTGPTDFLMGRHGYYNLYYKATKPELLTRELGKKFYSSGTFKPFPSCRATHTSIDCTLQLVKNNNIDPEKIDTVAISVTPGFSSNFVCQPFELGEFAQARSFANIPYVVANVLLRKNVRLEHFTEETIRIPEIARLIEKIKIYPTLPAEKPEFAIRVSIRMKGSKEISAYEEVPRGDPIQSPLTRADLKEKFRDTVAFSGTLPKQNTEKALEMMENLEEIKDVAQLVKLLVK